MATNRDLRRISKAVKKSEGDRASIFPMPTSNRRSNGHTIVKLLAELVNDNEVDAVYTYWESGWNDDTEQNKFKVKGFGEFGTYPAGTRGICFTSGDTWFFAIPYTCPEDEEV